MTSDRAQGLDVLETAEALLLAEQPDRASAVLRDFLPAHPESARGWHTAAMAAASQGRLDEAIQALRRAVQTAPAWSWFRDLGALLFADRQPRRAIQAFARAQELGGQDWRLSIYYADALLCAGYPLRALSMYREAGTLYPAHAEPLRGQGRALIRLRRLKAAIEALRKACEIDPSNHHGHQLIACTYMQAGAYDLAVRHFRLALEVATNVHQAKIALSWALSNAGQLEEYEEIMKPVLAGERIDPDLHFAYVSTRDHAEASAKESRRYWEEWAARHRAPAAMARPNNIDYDPGRVLRIGYMADDIHTLPTNYFIPPLFENRDRENFDTFCYLTSSARRDYPKLLRRLVPNTVDVRGKQPDEIARQIRSDRIDILVNVSWERSLQLRVFTYRPALIQVEAPHYPATTGLFEADYILSDPWICPLGAEPMYTERVYRLFTSYMPWGPPAPAPPIQGAPIVRNKYCTFGLFQKPAKLNRELWDVIAETVRLTPGSRLLIHQNTLDLDDPESATRKGYAMEMSRRGVDAARLRFTGARAFAVHLKIIGTADIALDSFPYSGTTTTGECLWMGVPVVTLPGETHASRVSLSMLARLNLECLAAGSFPDYARIASELACDTQRLVALREELRPKMAASVVTNGRAVMAGIEGAYRQMWIAYCKEQRKNHESNE